MSVLGAILPILFWAVLVTCFIVFKPFSRMRKIIGFQWIFAGYFSLLLFSVVLYYFLPADHSIDGVDVSIQDESDAEMSFFDAANKGKIDQSPEGVLKKEWEFPLKDTDMRISIESGTFGKFHGEPFILAERTKKGTVLKVEHYVTRTILSGLDVTGKMPSPELELEGDSLYLKSPDPVEMNFSFYTNGFTTRQFKGEKVWDSEYENLIGSDILYLRIPEGVDITGPVEFIEDSN
ncbi:hypothetical protein FGG79_19405 [Bacillus sp. BHET2]|uniref:hypothetical protein n=1 Tax=Bacillus sp. BHET2 TaxID=2583818 RepID=UPI00110F5CF3|nr:hypothetical protein [Bacillus sp. BHET2]TMU83593.1 hypothetical protein FGG79_19405 [Bacillus sp. BHET2]